MKGVNDDEINAMVDWTRVTPVHVRFIELMPFSGNHWNPGKLFTLQEILQTIEATHDIVKLGDEPHDTTKKYIVPGYAGTFAIISTMSSPFCNGCNRIRLTADGKIKNCLFSKDETDLLKALRNGESVETLIRENILAKHAFYGGQFEPNYQDVHAEKIQNRSMIAIGG